MKYRCALIAVLLELISFQALLAQGTDPGYLVEMPSADKVKSVIKGKDPDDTMARQVAVFTYLPEIIQNTRDPKRPIRAGNTPDEVKILNAYRLTAYQITQDYAKSHTPDQVKQFQGLHGRYEMDEQFYNEWFNALFSPEFRDAYHKGVAAMMQRYQAHVQQETRQNSMPSQPAPSGGSAGALRPLPPTNDPGTLAARRCLELGGSSLECVGQGVSSGHSSLFGGANPSSPIKSIKKPGLRMTGNYRAAGTVSLEFTDAGVEFGNCGELVQDTRQYSVESKGGQVLIALNTDPKPVVLALGADGKLNGPGPVDVTGRVVTGNRHYVVSTPGHFTKYGNFVYGTSQEQTEPIYGSKTVRCTVSTLAPAGPTLTAGSGLASILGVVTGQTPEQATKDAQKDLPPPGLRMAGSFVSRGGFKIEFAAAGAVLDCGEAHVKAGYAITRSANQVHVDVQNPGSPFSIIVQPDGSLNGPASVAVSGRVLTGMRGDEFVFAPRNATCTVGTLTPQ